MTTILNQSIENMPLFSSKLHPAIIGSDGYTLRRWVPCADVRQAIVVLDHELIGEAIISAARAMTVGGDIGPTAIYTVGFDTDQFGLLYRKRAEHLTMQPTDLSMLGIEKTGNGPQLLSFLAKRVLPAIAEEWPNLQIRPAMVGFSLSGLFALQAVTQFPRLFGDVAAFSPSLFLDDKVQQRLTGLLAKNPCRRLFLAAGKLEEDRTQTGLEQHMYELVAELGARLEADYGDRIATAIPETETHFSLPFSTMTAMLRHLLADDERYG